ncbi:MAG: hypothetical protein GXO75_18410, partial [Calditrichaeota bacterium]|nr:hypothetical protein [Calditrichota bacterium]
MWRENIALIPYPQQATLTTKNFIFDDTIKIVSDEHTMLADNFADMPQARKTLLRLYGDLFDRFTDIGLDYFTLWPYDEEGCTCSSCWPWGGRAFPDAVGSHQAQSGR